MFRHKDELPSGRILTFMILHGQAFFYPSVSTFIIASDSSCLFKIGAEVRAVRWKISNNTHPVPVLNNTHPFPSKCSVDALCRVRESAAFATQRSRVRIPPGPPNQHDGFDTKPSCFFYNGCNYHSNLI